MRNLNGDRRKSKLTKLSDLLCSDPRFQSASDDDDEYDGTTSPSPLASAKASPGYYSDHLPPSSGSSPYNMSPWNPASSSPFIKSPWFHAPADHPSLLATLIRQEGHVYSLASSGDLLYTGSESKNIRVWRRWQEFSAFKSSSGLVKSIIVAGGRIFTGHQDGKIRVWKSSHSSPAVHKRVGTLPRLRDYLKSSVNRSNYVKVRRHRSTIWLRHFDAVSCLALDEEGGLLYSGSWDKTFKVWRIADSKCLESVTAHDDAINAVAAAPGGTVFTGSADGTVKMWRREAARRGGGTRHVAAQTLLKQDSTAVTSLTIASGGAVLYSGSSDGVVNWWFREWRMVHGGTLRGHRMAVLCLAAAGRMVVSGSADKTLCVWRREAGGDHVKLSVLAGHEGPVKCLTIGEVDDSEGRWIVYSGSLDRSVKVWQVSEREAISTPSPLHVLGNAGERWRGGARERDLHLEHVD